MVKKTDFKVYDEDWFDQFWFNKRGMHKITETRYDENWYDTRWWNRDDINEYTQTMYDEDWFDKYWYHIKTWTKYNEVWFDQEWYDKNWYNKDWFDKDWYDENWYDREWYDWQWYDKERYDRNWKNIQWFDKESQKEYDEYLEYLKSPEFYKFMDLYNTLSQEERDKLKLFDGLTTNSISSYECCKKVWKKKFIDTTNYLLKRERDSINAILWNWFHLVWVQFESKYTPNTFYWRIYTYRTKCNLKYNEIIEVPTANWTKKARIVNENVNPHNISCNLSDLKTINEWYIKHWDYKLWISEILDNLSQFSDE